MNNRSNRTVSQQGKVMTNGDIYAPAFVKDLFDEMTQTYGIVNLISSFGFARLWRRQCIRSIQLSHDAIVLDLMTGMGELCPHLLNLIGRNGTVYAVDLSPVMCDRARQHMKNGEKRLQVIEANALNCPFEDESVDAVVSTFGLFYINWIIPLIGWLAAGNPGNYRLLGIYTPAFQNCNVAAASFAAARLAVNYQSYFSAVPPAFAGSNPAPKPANRFSPPGC